jgi:RHS repeat-associated protein
VLSTTNTYDSHGRLKGITQRNSTGIIAQSTYDLDNLNRLTATTKNGQTQTYDYDSTDQVQTVTGSNSESYTYDKNGNRTNSGYVTDAGNRLRADGTYNYEYDSEGNRTMRTKIADGTVDTYRWDYRNRLMGIVTKNLDGVVTRTVGYTYDVGDRRVSKTVDGVVENYYLDGEQIAFVTDGGGNETEHYLYGLNVDQVLAADSATGMLWALADRLGSIDTLTDADGHVVDERTFDSFGRLLSQSNPAVSFRYGYTGRELDAESGLDYYRARYYDSSVGRFVSVDPMGFGAGDTNLYRYVGNNSTNATDPSGEWINFAIGAGIGFVSDLGMQLWDNRGTDKGIDLTRLAISTGIGAISGGVGGALIKQGTGLAARTAINAGVGFNTGYYGKVLENGIKGNDLTDGAVVNGIGAGAGAAVGELLFAGAGAVWKSEGVQSALARATSVVGDVWNGAGQKASDSLRKWVIQQSRARQNGWTSETGAIDLGIIDERIFNPSRLLPSPVNPLSLNSRSILQSAIEDGRVSIGIPTNAEIRYVQSIRRKALQG